MAKKSYFTKDQKEEITDIIVDALHEVVIPVLSDMSDDIKDIKANVERLDNKVEMTHRQMINITDRHGDKQDNLSRHQADHEKRIRKLEAKTVPN